ncbi:helix-turn-helix domain-containing protein [Arcticibacter sp.]|jgi:AraC-like DNA-binding protein|uniref:helix-turn-helix domain-containing protein n=1 Tax=Arcticibacter sp. TaxID=1872630 RepID=UPI00388F9C8E
MKQSIPIYDISSISESGESDILVSRFAEYAQAHHHLHYPHRHNFYHIVLFTKGRGTHAIDFENFEVRPYQIYFMIPGQVHSWDFQGVVDGYVINFSTSFFQSFLLRPDYLENFVFFNGSLSQAVIDIPLSKQQHLGAVFEQILLEFNHQGRFGSDLLRTLLLQIFIGVSRTITEHDVPVASTYNQILLRNFRLLIDKHFNELRLPKEYADLLYITPNHLNALCNDTLGFSAGELIRKRVMLESKRLLVNLNLSISEIADQLNFSDNSYFSRFFKKYTGTSPEEFRKKIFKKEKNEQSRIQSSI